jgi:hypothetical protein
MPGAPGDLKNGDSVLPDRVTEGEEMGGPDPDVTIKAIIDRDFRFFETFQMQSRAQESPSMSWLISSLVV